jgi:hypothetical protein
MQGVPLERRPVMICLPSNNRPAGLAKSGPEATMPMSWRCGGMIVKIAAQLLQPES